MFNQEEANKKKSLLQEEISNLSLYEKDLMVILPTGTGKARAAILSIFKSLSNKKWLVVVPEITLIQNFKDDVTKHGIDIWDKIEDIICYASLHKYENSSLNILLDEGHHSSSDIRIDYLMSIKSDQRIVLSATLNDDIKKKLNNWCNWFEYTITLDDAIKRGILPEPDIRTVPIELDDIEKIYPYKFGKKVINLTARQYYNKVSDTITYWNNKWEEEGKPYMYNKYLLTATNRKRWLSEYKTTTAKKIIKSIGNQRFICFTGSVKQAKELGGSQSIHSKNTKNKNQEIIDDFNNLQTSRIFTCQMLREGTNLTDCPISICCQLDSDIRSFLQMSGRAYRNSNPKVYILFIRNTQDEKYLNKLISKIGNQYIKEYKV